MVAVASALVRIPAVGACPADAQFGAGPPGVAQAGGEQGGGGRTAEGGKLHIC